MKANSRRTAAFAVARWLATKDFPQQLLPEGPERAFVQGLVYTVIRRLRVLRKILGELVKKWPKGELEALLYVGAAQILFMDDVPDFAAVNETVEAAKTCGNPSVAKVVNGVLRNIVRNQAEIRAAIAAEPLEVRESFPTALVRRWRARFGEERTAALCAWHNLPAETFLARKDGSFVKLERGQKVAETAGYAEGEFIVQDPGTAHAVELMAVKPGDAVVDVCAAPGGKTVQLAWRGAKVTACEVNPKRRARLVENLQRLKLDVAVVSSLADALEDNKRTTTRSASAVQPSTSNLQPAAFTPCLCDSVLKSEKIANRCPPPPLPSTSYLVDAPCSNTGVFRRRPDARWNWTEEKLAELVKLQASILDQVAPLVPEGGTIVYSTCSLEAEENEDQVAAFLKRHPDFIQEVERFSFPPESGTDGAYAARLVRKAAC